ncbi:phosphoglycerate mutase (2,3-diphosphoglycerate-independent) [Candidatus Woesebacteria bacterium GWB1_43_5]|uniref:2,3-bisphosphoglycerate-independent phosphoglycerate mutase n=1 Tax=Candidatus Woesebacteria bacterium GWB1_43_5 TaxID=1802474 RepID=A0A1F7WS19_9BACT|nr:MAG: phosphoglycerate mutase (2,3-diphosphoglycerate-independent) [Candidatus Woesebacteria bacterium GWB1_43_5]
MNPSFKSRFVVLVVLDGWGLAVKSPGNAIMQASVVNFDKYWASCPHTQLAASGEAVGLPPSEVGNTEVGHLNIGAGRIVYQDLTRINMSIADGSFFKNDVLLGAFAHARKNNSNLHYLGLLGAGGVHSSIEHLYALIQLAAREKFDRLYLHLFTDGRDSPVTGAATYVKDLKQIVAAEGVGKIATIMGRYWAMDRDRRWERTEKAYKALTQGVGQLVKSPEEAIADSYNRGITDEFVKPSIIMNENSKPTAVIADNDAVIFFNFRVDRPRQLTYAFVAKDFGKLAGIWDYDPYQVVREGTRQPKAATAPTFQRRDALKNLYFAMMTQYGKAFVDKGALVAFPPERVALSLGRVISEAGLKQLMVSESEKERFVTFYFNGQQEVTFPGEERLIVPSPKVPTYDQKPEMSSRELTDALLTKLKSDRDYAFVLVNYASPDMVGHTGNIGAAVKACEAVDECVGRLANFVLAYDGTMLITADHGNVEQMINHSTGTINTEHTANPVPFIAVSKNLLERGQSLQSGILADIAPTVLSLLGLPIADTMTGRNLLENA